MSEKSDGVDFDRQAFVRPQEPSGPKLRVIEVVLVLAVIAAMALGIKLLPLFLHGEANSSDPDLAQMDKRLSEIEARLERLEAARRTAAPVKKDDPPGPSEA